MQKYYKILAVVCLLITKTAIATNSYHQAVTKALPAVVSIHTTAKFDNVFQDPFFKFIFKDYIGDEQRRILENFHGLGSGVIISNDGYIVTNQHVIAGATDIKVKLHNDKTYTAEVIGSSADVDLAVLKIKAKGLQAISIGDSKKLKVGDIVLAIGSPLGLGQSVTQGIVSALNRKDLGVAKGIEEFLQTDAAINQGSSGGALVDTKGQLIGINTAIGISNNSRANIGINFAIPITPAYKVIQEFIQKPNQPKASFGLYLVNMNDKLKQYTDYKGETKGVYVQATIKDSAAQKAGLQPADIITKINNINITSLEQGVKVIENLTPKKSYMLEVFRDKKLLNIKIIPQRS